MDHGDVSSAVYNNNLQIESETLEEGDDVSATLAEDAMGVPGDGGVCRGEGLEKGVRRDECH